MHTPQPAQKTSIEEFSLDYQPAVLHEWASGWQIEYWVINPSAQEFEKKRIRVEKIKNRLGEKGARQHIGRMCAGINAKLRRGWNPYQELAGRKSMHKLSSAINMFLKLKKRDVDTGSFRSDGLRTYSSQLNMLKTWLTKRSLQDTLVGSFQKRHALDYLEFVYMEKKVGARTYNNYVALLRTFWNWMIQNDYCIENIFNAIKKKPTTRKERVVIPPDCDEKIMTYFRAHAPEMEMVCALVYNSFMRPAEIARTKIHDIYPDKNAIHLSKEKTKNKHERWCLLPPYVTDLMQRLGVFACPGECYLLSTDLKPGVKKIETRDIDKYWSAMRIAAGIPPEMKLYSYRDTGITDMKKMGHANIFIQSITGHLNEAEINTYSHLPDPRAMRFIMNEAPELGRREPQKKSTKSKEQLAEN